MQPKKYLEDIESSERRSKIIKYSSQIAIFLSCLLLLGPIIHELSHIAVLKLYNCFYYFTTGFGILTGLYGKVTPLCSPSAPRLALFYAIGYISTITAGGLLSIASSKLSDNAGYLAAAGAGMLLSVLLSIGSEGDIQNFLGVLGVSQSYALPLISFLMIGVFITSLRTLQMIMELEGEE